MAVRHTSCRLKGQMLLAMPTAMPVLALTRMVGKVAGSKVGSCMVLSKLSTKSTVSLSMSWNSSRHRGSSLASV